MIRNSGSMNNLSESVEVLCLSVIQFSFGFTNVESITIPVTGFVDSCNQLRFLRAVETIFIRKEILITT